MTGQWKKFANSGLPIKDCLHFLISSQSDRTNKFRLHSVLLHLESGNSLKESFQFAQGFPDLLARLLAVAENSDQLPTILRALQQLCARGDDGPRTSPVALHISLPNEKDCIGEAVLAFLEYFS